MCAKTEPKRKIRISKDNFWDKRSNLDNKPSLSHRSIKVIEQIMEDNESLTIGRAIEKLMVTPSLYDEMLEKLREDYGDIKN